MRSVTNLSLLLLMFVCPSFVWAQTKRSPEFKEKYTLKEVVILKSATIIQYTIKGRFMSR